MGRRGRSVAAVDTWDSEPGGPSEYPDTIHPKDGRQGLLSTNYIPSGVKHPCRGGTPLVPLDCAYGWKEQGSGLPRKPWVEKLRD